MIKQNILSFKLSRTKDEITARSGLALYSEFLRAFGIKGLVEKFMPPSGSNRGYPAYCYIEPILLMLTGGGKTIEDLREIHNDTALRKLTGMEKMPSPSTVGDWLRRQGNSEGLQALKKVIDITTKKALSKDKRKEYTLYSDPTIIESEKYDAKRTYRGTKGYRPIIATLDEIPLIISHSFRQGNETGQVIEVIKKAYELLPEGKKISLACLDSEFYNTEVIEYLREKDTKFCIVVDKTSSVRDLIKRIKHWEPFKDRDGIQTEKQIGETVHTMNRLGFSFRLVVLRWKPKQRDLFSGEYCYHCIATDLEYSAEEVVHRYNERANIELEIRELKNGFGMDWIPTGDYGANSFWFSLGVLAYNSFVIQKIFIFPQFQDKTVKTLRWIFYEVAGKVVEHARKLYLKINVEINKFILYSEFRRRCVRLSA